MYTSFQMFNNNTKRVKGGGPDEKEKEGNNF